MNEAILDVTGRIRERSRASRDAYLARTQAARDAGRARSQLSCGNLAHAFAASVAEDRDVLRNANKPNIAVVSSYNDVLSAHQPFERFPELIKKAAREVGAAAQFAGGVPAMCDGVTQGQPGMEMSLFSRDVIAMATAIALSHNIFDGVLCLGVCDKIVPGLLIGALCFGHLPVVFVPGGPMPSGLPNKEKARIRQLHAQAKAGHDELLDAESKSYHAPGTCTFYGTANSNQMLMEVMGLHLPGASFVPANTPLRDALTVAATRRVSEIIYGTDAYIPLAEIVDERAVVNGIVGLLATGGSTNHTIHIVAIARAAGIWVNWDDFAALSSVVPLLARVYPNGEADINHFQDAGGMAHVIGELLDGGLLHSDVRTVAGDGLHRYREVPRISGDDVTWEELSGPSGDSEILRSLAEPFTANGGLKVLTGNLGRAVAKVSAIAPAHRVVEAPARVFDDQQALSRAFEAGELDRDLVAVIRFQGPRANGMPELHRLSPVIGVLQDRGHRVALVTDGRMSGASGKVPSAIHVTPESLSGGRLGLVRDGDVIRLDLDSGVLEARIGEDEWSVREAAVTELPGQFGLGRELFACMREKVGSAETGATVFDFPDGENRRMIGRRKR